MALPSTSLSKLSIELREQINYHAVADYLDTKRFSDWEKLTRSDPLHLPLVSNLRQLRRFYPPLFRGNLMYEAESRRVLFSRFALNFASLPLMNRTTELHVRLVTHIGLRISLAQAHANSGDYLFFVHG